MQVLHKITSIKSRGHLGN